MPSPQNHRKMSNQEDFNETNNRISELIAGISEQLDAITSITDDKEVDGIIAEQDKSDFIAKQAEIISNYRYRDERDGRDERIAELEAKIKSAQRQVKWFTREWFKERQRTKHLKAALKEITTVLNQD